MAEETVWRGCSSQWKNAGRYAFAALLCCALLVVFALLRPMASAEVRRISPFILWLLLVPIFMALARYLQTKSKTYELTNERLKITEGIFSRRTDTLELYRVKDLETRQPFLYRMARVENVQLNTSDSSSPLIFIEAIPAL
jgi:uncharacterized membrane protein YdbT with pleckstrin-like domain